jgi:hypothetical protein
MRFAENQRIYLYYFLFVSVYTIEYYYHRLYEYYINISVILLYGVYNKITPGV